MSALPPKADIGRACPHVRFVPKADIAPIAAEWLRQPELRSLSCFWNPTAKGGTDKCRRAQSSSARRRSLRARKRDGALPPRNQADQINYSVHDRPPGRGQTPNPHITSSAIAKFLTVRQARASFLKLLRCANMPCVRRRNKNLPHIPARKGRIRFKRCLDLKIGQKWYDIRQEENPASD